MQYGFVSPFLDKEERGKPVIRGCLAQAKK